MLGRSPLIATAGQKAALQGLSRSDVRGQADHARAALTDPEPGWLGSAQLEVFIPQGDGLASVPG